MNTQTKFTPGPWCVYRPSETALDFLGIDTDEKNELSIVLFGSGRGNDDGGIRGHTPQEAEANANLIASAHDLYAALEALTDFTEWSLARSELYAEEFRRETGMLAPFKDAGAVANEAEELHASRAEEWRAWCKRKRETLINNARTALKRARGEG